MQLSWVHGSKRCLATPLLRDGWSERSQVIQTARSQYEALADRDAGVGSDCFDDRPLGIHLNPIF
jgi:hypothetical protein